MRVVEGMYLEVSSVCIYTYIYILALLDNTVFLVYESLSCCQYFFLLSVFLFLHFDSYVIVFASASNLQIFKYLKLETFL